jgi:hypothetical protein
MTRYADPKSKSNMIIVKANTEPEAQLIKYFKEVCRRDGYEMRQEILSLLEHEWKNKHPPPGNPQLQVTQFDGSKKAQKLCEYKKCKNKAVWLCVSSYPFGKDQRLCSFHRKRAEYKREVCKVTKL